MRSFLGQGWAFPPAFDKESGKVNLVSDKNDIDQSLHILLSTSLGERVMQPQFGCNLKDFQFEALNNGMIGYIKDLVESSILLYEPRIELENVEITKLESMDLIEGKFSILIDYKISSTNSRFNYVYDFYLREANVSPV